MEERKNVYYKCFRRNSDGSLISDGCYYTEGDRLTITEGEVKLWLNGFNAYKTPSKAAYFHFGEDVEVREVECEGEVLHYKGASGRVACGIMTVGKKVDYIMPVSERWVGRLKRVVSFRLYRLFNRDMFTKLTKEQRQAVIIYDRTMRYPGACPTHLDNGLYLEYEPKSVYFAADYLKGVIMIKNHVFQYTIDMNDRMMRHIERVYNCKAYRTKERLERKYDLNVRNSLSKVIENIGEK